MKALSEPSWTTSTLPALHQRGGSSRVKIRLPQPRRNTLPWMLGEARGDMAADGRSYWCLGDRHSPAGCQGLVLSSEVPAGWNWGPPHPGSNRGGFFVPKGSAQLRAGRSSQVTSRGLFGGIKQICHERVAFQHVTGSGPERDRATLRSRCWSPALLCRSNTPGLHTRVSPGCKNPSSARLRGPGRKGRYNFEVSQNTVVI